MVYVKVEFEKAGIAYQEVDYRGAVRRYLDENGVELFEFPPSDDGCRVLEAEPAKIPDAVTTATAIKPEPAIETPSSPEVAYDWRRDGDRRSGRDRRRG